MSGGGWGMELMQRRRALLMANNAPKIVNLCPAATGTEILTKFTRNGGNMQYLLTGLEPNQDYTLQVTITGVFATDTSRRLYFFSESSSGHFIDTSVDTVPKTKKHTVKSTDDGQITISHNFAGLNNHPEYAAALTNIMVEIGSVAHPYVPYIEP